MKWKIGILWLIVSLVLTAAPVLAQEGLYVIGGGGKNGTPISSVPYTISAPGMYYLSGNLTCASTTQDAITINASDVTLDLMGYCLTGPGKTEAGITSGIASTNSFNVEIRNGSIKNFGSCGVYSFACTGIRVLGVRVRDIGASGIWVSGTNHLIASCSAITNNIGICSNGGTTIIKSNHVSGNLEYGILASSRCTVADNLVMDNAAGIWVGGYSTITGNTVRDNTNFGIDAGDYSTVVNNTTKGLTSGTHCTLANNTVY